MHFENDIFVSYAHIDDQALTEGQKGWISSLHRALEVRLAQLLGKPPRIFRDPKLQGNDYFADRLVERLPRAAAMISVLSPRYVSSDWCTRELREFLKASRTTGGVRVADKSRVFKVVKTPIPREQHPPELQDLLGYDFYFVEPETGRARELSPTSEPEAQRRYWTRLDDLAHDLSDLLTALDSRPEGAPGDLARGSEAGPDAGPEGQTPAAAVASRGTVYLAETSFDLRDKRDTVKRELAGHGYEVLPDRPLPLVAPECEALVREQLGRSRMSVHLIGRNYGVVPEGARESIVALQSELAVERGAAGDFSRLIWLPPGLTTDDDRQRRFVEALQTDPRLTGGADLLETPLEELTAALNRRLEPPAARAEPAAAAAGEEGPCRVYLICDQRDLDSTPPLEDHLFAQGFEVIVPVFSGEESEVRRDHEENLVHCDAALVYYGAAGELWLRQKLRELQKSPGYGRTRPFRAVAILVAPPATAEKRRLRTHEALVLQAGEELELAGLDPFVRQLQLAKAMRA